MTHALDDLDRFIIDALQHDARNVSAREIAERRDLSPSTVRKRIHRLEETGVIRGYRPDLDAGALGYDLRVLLTCSAPIPEREALARAAADVDGVVEVRELMTGQTNVHVDVLVTDRDDVTRIARELTACGLEVVDEFLVRTDYSNPQPTAGRSDDYAGAASKNR